MAKLKEGQLDYSSVGRIVISVVLLRGQVEALDKLVEKTGRSKSELIREALTVLLNVYQDMK